MRPARARPAAPWTLVEQHYAGPHGRFELVLGLPPAPLDAFVEAVWASRGEDVFTREEILPRTPTEVLFALGETHWLRDPAEPARDRAFTRAFVSGLQQGPLAVESPAAAQMAGIRLRPAGAAAFLRDSPAAIAGAVIDLDALLGAGVESLRDQLAGIPRLGGRVRALAAAVESHLAEAPAPPPEVRGALARLAASGGTAPVGELVAASGWSHRHFAARFRAEVGLAPKAFARLARFEGAFARLQKLARPRWAEFAAEQGYYDQAHMIRDFRALAGTTPVEVHRRRAPDGLGLLSEEELARA